MTIDTTDCEECGTLGVSIGANCPRCGGLIPHQCNRDALMIDIDELERIVKAGDRYGHNTPGVTLALIAEVRALREDAGRYQWLRSEGLAHIKFNGLTSDTCDIGLDHAIDVARGAK